jgi:YfiH family protein
MKTMVLPKPNGEFAWTQESWGPALRCVPLSRAALHCFGARQLEDGAALPAALSLDMRPEAVVRLRQVHGNRVVEACGVKAAGADRAHWPEGDIVISRDPSLLLTVRTADCVPVLLGDRRTNAVAAIHAGWRGTAAGAVLSAVDAMASTFGTVPSDLIAAVGPSIGPCCYAVGDELVPEFAAHRQASTWFARNRDGRLRLNLWQATRDQLVRAGLQPDNIHVSGLCTADHPQLFHSFRRDGRTGGRLIAAIRAAEEVKIED